MTSPHRLKPPLASMHHHHAMLTLLPFQHRHRPASTTIVQYQNLDVSSVNNTGYASANLKLLSMEYSLFKYLPFDFCGSWVTPSEDNGDECPTDGVYGFSLPYVLPWDDQDITTWVATGWQGTTNLVVYSNSSASATTLASCKLHWKTYVTQSSEDGWHTLPSAAHSAIILACIMAAMCLFCTYLTCCRRRGRNKAMLDVIEPTPEGEATGSFKRMDDSNDEKSKSLLKLKANTTDPDWA